MFGSALAFDRSIATSEGSVRSYDADGRLHISRANISKSLINEYAGREVPNYVELGLAPDRLYKFLRDPNELQKAAPTFNNIPLLSRHVPVSATDHRPEDVVGSTGTDAAFSAPYLTNSLVVWSGDEIKFIESDEKRQLSCSYRWRPDMTPGVYDGMPYDGVMRDIIGNHVAIVVQGRAGADVLIGDEQPKEDTRPPTAEKLNMTAIVLSRKATLAHGAVLGFVRPLLASDALPDLTPAFAGITAANFKASKPKIAGAIAERLNGKLAADKSLDDLPKLLAAFDAMDPAEEEDKPADKAKDKRAKDKAKAKDADPDDVEDAYEEGYEDGLEDGEDKADKAGEKAAGDKRKAKDRKAKDADPDKDKEDDKDKDKEKKASDGMISKHAMDAAITAAVRTATEQATNIQREIRDAEREVRPYVGDLALAHDSAEAVYRTTLATLGEDSADLEDLPVKALKAILKRIPVPGAKQHQPPRLAADASAHKGFAERFPEAARIRAL